MNEASFSREAGELLAQLGDSAIAVSTDRELLEKVPFVSYIAKTFAVKEAFHVHRLTRNCRAFLEAAKEGDISKLADRLREVINDPKRLWELEDTALQILIEGEKPVKAELLGRLLRALADGKLNPEQFDTISLLLLSASVPALLAIPEFFKTSKGEVALHGGEIRRIEPLLLSLGVASRNGTKLEVSEFGKLLYEIGFRK